MEERKGAKFETMNGNVGSQRVEFENGKPDQTNASRLTNVRNVPSGDGVTNLDRLSRWWTAIRRQLSSAALMSAGSPPSLGTLNRFQAHCSCIPAHRDMQLKGSSQRHCPDLRAQDSAGMIDVVATFRRNPSRHIFNTRLSFRSSA